MISIQIPSSLSSVYAALASEEHLTFTLLLLWIMHNLLHKNPEDVTWGFCAMLGLWNMQNPRNAYWNGCSWFFSRTSNSSAYKVMQLAPFIFFDFNEMNTFFFSQWNSNTFRVGYKLRTNTLNEWIGVSNRISNSFRLVSSYFHWQALHIHFRKLSACGRIQISIYLDQSCLFLSIPVENKREKSRV